MMSLCWPCLALRIAFPNGNDTLMASSAFTSPLLMGIRQPCRSAQAPDRMRIASTPDLVSWLISSKLTSHFGASDQGRAK